MKTFVASRNHRALGAISNMGAISNVARALPFRPLRPSLQRKPSQRSSCTKCVSDNAHASSGKFTITTPLYYANAAPHMGSAYPTIAADVVARYNRLKGKSVRFVTGTDEHGEKIALAAEKRGMTPQQHCDSIVEEYKSLWQQVRR